MNRKITLSIASAALFAMASIAAACGSSASGSSYSSGPYGSGIAPNRSTHSAAATVGDGRTPRGRIVVDGKGRTLSLFEKDKRRHSAC